MVEVDHLPDLEPRERPGQMTEVDHLPNLELRENRSNSGGGSPSYFGHVYIVPVWWSIVQCMSVTVKDRGVSAS